MRLVITLTLILIVTAALSRTGSVYLTVLPIVIGVWTHLVLANSMCEDEDEDELS